MGPVVVLPAANLVTPALVTAASLSRERAQLPAGGGSRGGVPLELGTAPAGSCYDDAFDDVEDDALGRKLGGIASRRRAGGLENGFLSWVVPKRAP